MNPLIVVTGGTKGIGLSIVERFRAEGFDAVVCARSVEAHPPAQEDKTRLFAVAADLATRDGVKQLIEFIQRLDRPVDVLVNNTGIFLPGQIHSEAEGTFEQIMATNVASAYHLTRGLLSDMLSRRVGHIFMMCSTASITAYANGGSYCISKYALLGMSRVLREETKSSGVKVTAVLPGATLTASWEGTELPEDRFMKPDDVAQSVWAAYALSKSAVVEEILIRPQLGDI